MSQHQMIRNISGQRKQGSAFGFVLTIVLWAIFAVAKTYF